MFEGKEVPRISVPESCPGCGLNRLVRNGCYRRRVVEESGEEQVLSIQRLRCRGCNGSHSLLYDFLVPYRKFTVSALKVAVAGYLETSQSHLGTLTDAVKDVATVFSAIECLLASLPMLWMRLAGALISGGHSVSAITRKGHCPNSIKSRKAGKREQLDWAAQVLELIPEVLERSGELGISVFAGRVGCRLLRTHRAECVLF